MRSLARFLRSEPFAVAGAAIYAVIIAAALLADRIAPHNPTEILRANRRIPSQQDISAKKVWFFVGAVDQNRPFKIPHRLIPSP